MRKWYPSPFQWCLLVALMIAAAVSTEFVVEEHAHRLAIAGAIAIALVAWYFAQRGPTSS